MQDRPLASIDSRHHLAYNDSDPARSLRCEPARNAEAKPPTPN